MNYDSKEERINAATHFVGIPLSFVFAFFLLSKEIVLQNQLAAIGFSVFALAMLLLYSASTVYHASKEPARKSKLRILDHCAIFVLIAGTYTPFLLVPLHGKVGAWMLPLVWGIALLGIILKVFFTGRFAVLSLSLYLFMGWIIVFAAGELAGNLNTHSLGWLVAGGISYTIGAVFYAIKKLPYSHGIFHIFVLLGTGCHFYSLMLI